MLIKWEDPPTRYQQRRKTLFLIDEIEKLINEHGSATILKERILLLRDQHDVLINENASLKEKIANAETEISKLKDEMLEFYRINKELEFDNKKLSNELNKFHSDNPDNEVCDHCGSKNLKRCGSKLNAKFGRLGVKDALYSCNDCNKQSAFMINPKK